MALPLFNIGGLASGLDTNAIVAGLMAAARTPINQLEARKGAYEAKDAAWQAVNTRLAAVGTALEAIKSPLDFDRFATAASSYEPAVTASPIGPATPSALSFTVDQLATNHQMNSATSFTSGSDLVGAGDFTITQGGEDLVITTSPSTTLSDLAQQINGLDSDVSANVIGLDATTFKLVLSADDTGVDGVFTSSGTMASLSTMDVMQAGVDAQLTMGAGPGALTITRSSNSITDLISGVNLDLHGVSLSQVTVTVDRDVDAAVEAVKLVVDEINSTLSTLADYTKYISESETAGALLGDPTARSIISNLRNALSATINEASVEYPIASSIGISLGRDGTFAVNESKLRDALEADFGAVTDLFVESGHSLDTRMSFVASGDAIEGDYEVVISQAASHASALSNRYRRPNSDTTFQIIVGATSVDVTVLRHDNITESLDAINSALVAAGVNSVTATQVDINGTDYIQLDHASFGSGAGFDVVGDPFGLAGSYAGTDVAGTVGGESATGSGQLLSVDAGDPSGMQIRVTASQDDVDGAGGSLSLGDLTFAAGIGGALDTYLDRAQGAGGSVARARDFWQARIDFIDDRIDVFEDRLERKEAALIRQFARLETAMASLTAQAQWLAAALPGLNQGTQR